MTEKEGQKIVARLNQLNRLTAAFYLGQNPLTGMKELLTGTWATISRTMVNKIDKQDLFGYGDWGKGISFTLGDSVKGKVQFNYSHLTITDEINEMFQLMDMSLHRVVQKKRSSYRSIPEAMDDRLFVFSKMPDYFHRMSVFVAQMIHDGILKLDASGRPSEDSAIRYVNGKMVYRPEKDDRFAAYFAHQVEPTDPQERKRYLEAKIRYETLVSSLVADGKMQQGDPLRMFYDMKQRNSMTAYSDMIYGSYDPANQWLFRNTTFGRVFGLFRTYLNTRKDKYFLSTQVNMRHGHWEMRYDENGNPTGQVWVGRPMEGIIQSFAHVFKIAGSNGMDIGATFRDWRNMDSFRKANLALFGFDMFQFLLISLLLSWFFSEDSEDEGNTAQAFHRIIQSSAKDLFILKTIGDITGNYNPIASFSFVSDFANGLQGVFTGDTKAMKSFVEGMGVYRSATAFIPSEN
jgi:hypothetical protein